MTELVGRMHPLLVHLPIGILLLAVLFEWLAYFKRYRVLRRSISAMLFFGAAASTLSVITGLSLASSGAYDDRLIELHKNTGIITTVFAWLIFFVKGAIVRLFQQKKKKRLIRMFLFVPLAALVALTGHFGGSLTHGEDYLTGVSSEEKSKGIQLSLAGDPDSAQVYQDVVAPILDSRCYSCHGAAKQKGQLRLDQPEFILRGGKHGKVIGDVSADSSELYKRLMLPLEHDEHMPPNEKPQLASAELAILHAWLEAGAPFDARVSQLASASDVKRYVSLLSTPSSQKRLVPETKAAPAESSAVSALTKRGVIVIPLSDSTNYLSASFVNARDVTDSELTLLLPLKEQLLWLDLGRTQVSSVGMKTVGQLSRLTRLNIQHTAVDDAGMSAIGSLKELQSINVVGTRITDAGLFGLSGIPTLEKVYCYGTGVSRAGLEKLLRERLQLRIDTGGYRLPARVTDTLEFKAPKR